MAKPPIKIVSQAPTCMHDLTDFSTVITKPAKSYLSTNHHKHFKH